MATKIKKQTGKSAKRKANTVLKTANPEVHTYWKCTRSDGTDFYTGKVSYADALRTGEPIEVANAEPPKKQETGDTCGRGLHVCDTPRKTIRFVNRIHRPYRWFEVSVAKDDVIESDHSKTRVRRLTVVGEIGLTDIFGPDFARNIEACRAESATWKAIPWLKPDGNTTEDDLETLFGEWHDAITPWLRDRKTPPRKCRIVRDRAAAYAADAVVAADAAVVAAAVADADAADAAYADAAADADAADAADAAAAAAYAADAAAAAAADAFPWWSRWYVRPRSVLHRHARWIMVGLKEPSPYAPLVAMFRAGARPIGYVRGEFVIYFPEIKDDPKP